MEERNPNPSFTEFIPESKLLRRGSRTASARALAAQMGATVTVTMRERTREALKPRSLGMATARRDGCRHGRRENILQAFIGESGD
jgi:hypothetical protein